MNRSDKLASKNIRDILALTPLQEGMLFHYLQAPGEDSYFNQLDLEVSGVINPRYFEEAWNFVIEINEMLRTVFRWEKLEKPTQVVLERHTLYWRFEDLSNVGEDEEQKKQWETIKQHDRNNPFDLRQVPFRVILGKMAQNRYQMLISNHHILYDGWSTGIILREFFQAYETVAVGNQPQVHRVKPRFKEFIRWHREQDRLEQKKFWQNYLEGFAAPTRLPVKRSQPGPAPPGKSNYRLHLSQGVKDKLDAFVKDKRITLAAVFYCAWGILLQKYCGLEDVVFGITVSGRSAPIRGIEDMVGLFINTIPLRAGTEPGEGLPDFLVRINNHLAASEKYENTPLVDIHSYTQRTYQGGEELFDTLVVLENYPLDTYLRELGPRLSIRSYSIEERPHYDLTLAITTGEGIDINLNYNNHFLEKETVVRLAGHFRTILQGIEKNTGTRVDKVDMLSAEEKHQLIKEFNRTDIVFPGEKIIHRLFEEQVERAPDQVALYGCMITWMHGEEGSITYKELNKKSNQLAGLLIERGVKPDTIVGIMMERSVDMIIGILGILKSGGAYLPIDPEYPQERINYMLADSSARILLKKSGIRNPESREYQTNPDDPNSNDQNKRTGITVLDFEHLNFEFVSNFEFRASNFVSSNLAYIIYTSGTTGRPKGVMVEHRSLVNLIFSRLKRFNIDENDRVLQFSSICFDASVEQIFIALSSGAMLVLIDKSTLLDSDQFKTYISRQFITHFNVVPSFLMQMRSESPYSFKRVVIGGEICPLELSKKWSRYYDFYNVYGPTETTVTALDLMVNQAVLSPGIMPIGKPVINTRVYLFDKYMNLVPIGTVGEIHIGGAGVARGYLNKPELTAERFDYDFWDYHDYQDENNQKFLQGGPGGAVFSKSAHPGRRRLYKTGDLGRWLPDGNIEFLGRIDHQVKIRGYRIELGEIENCLLKISGVKEAVVLAREQDSGDKYICAYVVSDKDCREPGLREHLSRELPEYMIPSYFVPLEKIPLNPNGKIDRGALPVPGLQTGESYIAPGDEIEKKLVEIWSEVLGLAKEKISINDNFFHLGGHSLKATLLVSRIHKELKVNVPLPEIFKTSHIRGLAAFIKSGSKDRYIKIEAEETKEYYPVFPAQKRIYLSHQIDKRKVAYNLSNVVPLGEKIGIEKLKSSLKKLVNRHESLRTSFEMVKGQLVQRIHKGLSFEIEHFRLNKNTDNPAVSLPRTEKLLGDFIRPFDLSAPPLIRIGLMETGAGEHMLIFDIHHIITDGRSIEIFTEELMSLYTGKELLPLRLQYKDFSNWYNRSWQKILVKEQEKFWAHRFKNKIILLNLPTDFERPRVLTSEGGIVGFNLDWQKIRDLGKIQIETNTTMFMVLIAMYSIFLAKITNQEDILVGTPIAGRRHPDVQQITGMFVNTLVIRSQPTKNKSFPGFLSQVKEYVLGAFENQEYQFENLVELVAVKRDASRNPVFDTMFSYQDVDKKETGNIQLVTGQYDHKYNKAVFDLTLEIINQKDTLKCTFFYNKNLFKKSTVLRWGRYFQAAVDIILNRPGIKLEEIDILSGEDKQRILEKIDNAGKKYHQEEAPGKVEPRVKPATETERKILAIWEKILGEKTPGVTADFFQSGGSSIEALLLVTEINKTFKRKLSITDIYENQSIRKQAALVEETKEPDKSEKSAKDKNIIRLKVGSRGSKNIFLIHDATGEVDKYRLFCKELKPGDNYWGLPLKSTNGLSPHELKIRDLASGYLAAIKQVQARGPYYLGGWSIGGLIAFETARQLEQAGDQVEQLYMFDTAVPVKKTQAQSFDLAGELEWINRYFQVPVTVFNGIKTPNPEEFWQEFLNFIENDEVYNQAYIVDKLAEYSELISDFYKLPAAELFKYVNRFRSTASAGTNYFPGTKIKAKLHYYQAELSNGDAANWQEFFIEKIDIQQTRGNHFNMFNGPNLRHLIGIFQKNNYISTT